MGTRDKIINIFRFVKLKRLEVERLKVYVPEPDAASGGTWRQAPSIAHLGDRPTLVSTWDYSTDEAKARASNAKSEH